MTIDELIDSGVCEDMEEALAMFPIEAFLEFEPVSRERNLRDKHQGGGHSSWDFGWECLSEMV